MMHSFLPVPFSDKNFELQTGYKMTPSDVKLPIISMPRKQNSWWWQEALSHQCAITEQDDIYLDKFRGGNVYILLKVFR